MAVFDLDLRDVTVSPLSVLMLGFLAGIIYLVIISVYRLYFHPLAKFPGPKLAAITSFYEFYYSVIQKGMFVWEIKRMHDIYGPIVRVNPHEIHILDTEFYDEIYAASSKKRDKYASWVVFLGVPTGMFATSSHDHHRLRRGALNPFFSKKAIYDIEDLILSKVEKLSARFLEASKLQKDIRLDAALMALANDVITDYCYGESYDCLDEADFKVQFKENLMAAVSLGAFIRQFPWVVPVAKSLPVTVVRMVSEAFAALLEWERIIEHKVENLIQQRRAGKTILERSIFQELLDSKLPEEEKSRQRLLDEGKSLLGAGSETVSWTLTIILFYLTENPSILSKLREELADMPQQGPLWKYLEQKPYLSAIVSEGLRFNHGALGRLPRIAHEPLVYNDWVIPAKTPVSSTNYWIHMDENIFTSPQVFLPERWLKAQEAGFPLQKYLVSFSKGSRQCVGLNLAYAEIYLCTAIIATRFDLQLKQGTNIDDILPARETFIPRPKVGSKGVIIQPTCRG